MTAAKEFAHEDGKPNFDLVEPWGVARREVEGDAMVRVGEEGSAGGLGGQHAGPALDAELALKAARAGH